MEASIYRDMSERTGGEIYIGVVGPVRSGKSTFVRKFMEQFVLPNIENEYDRQRTADELPQSAGGRTVMTTEPKFVPDDAVSVSFDGQSEMKVKLVDCVGYLVPGALGDSEDGQTRMVNTPWSDTAIPFEKAAEIGTEKVIRDHACVGILVSSDGTVGDIPRENYVEAERRAAEELISLGKPFVIVLNSSKPESETSVSTAIELEDKYGVPVALLNCLDMDKSDIEEIFKLMMPSFPINEISISLPNWTTVLESGHWLRCAISEAVSESVVGIGRMGDIETFTKSVKSKIGDALKGKYGKDSQINCTSISTDMGTGKVKLRINLPESIFYRIIGEQTGLSIENEGELLSTLQDLAKAKKQLDRFATAIDEVNETGYGIVMPETCDMTLDEPEIVKQASGYGVKLRATAPSIHMIRANIETELSPMVGSEQQSEDLVKFLLEEFEGNPASIWNTNIFGKSIYELVNEGLHAKLEHMPRDARDKMCETLARVINEGAAGLVCIIL